MKKNKYTVLCVDDEKNVLNSLRRLLRKESYTLITAGGGEEGLDILEKTDVQLVISDQRMPDMGGTEFLSRVRELYPEYYSYHAHRLYRNRCH